MFSTSRDVQYMEGIPWVHWGDIMSASGELSTSGDILMHVGIPWVHWGMFSTSGGYYDGCERILWVDQKIFSTTADIMMHVGGYHKYIRGISWVHWVFNENWKALSPCSTICIMISPEVLNIPNLFMISSQYSSYPHVLNTPMYWTRIILGD